MYPPELLYTKDHEWIRVDESTGIIGITVDFVDGYPVVASMLPNSPALQAGLQTADVILRIDADADHVAVDPMVGQRLGPERIDLEPRRLDAVGRLCVHRPLELVVRGAEGDESDKEGRTDI